jgi:flavodoxin
MTIGLIVYSQTGNTHSVALKLQEKLAAAGHSAAIERVRPAGDGQPGATHIELAERPAIDPYDALVFGSPVRGFALSPAMISYLAPIASLQGKKVACLVTEYFPFPWMGGNRAIAQMRKLCESRGATVCGTGIVNWSSARRDRMIVEVVDRLASCFD